MRKFIIIFACICLLALLSVGLLSNPIKTIHKQAQESSLSYHIKVVKEYSNSNVVVSYWNVISTADFFLLESPDDKIWYVNNDSLVLIDHKSEEYSVFRSNKKNIYGNANWYELMLGDLQRECDQTVNIYSPYWEYSLNLITKSRPRMIDGVQYLIYQSKYKQLLTFENNSQEKLQYTISYFLKKGQNQIDMVEFVLDSTIKPTHVVLSKMLVEFQFNNISTNTLVNKINKTVYPYYSFHTEENLPNSRVCSVASATDVLTTDALSYPLVGIAGDTMTLNQYSGWLLLDFWSYECKSCLQGICDYSEEKHQVGHTLLEDAGITMVAINPYASNISRMKTEVSKYNIDYVFRAAKGISQYINVVKFPQYYLISPNKTIEYSHQGHIDNYQDIVNVVQTYSCKDSNISFADEPLIEFENVEYDFDTVVKGKTQEGVFLVKNIGKSPLVINKVETSCGCTVPTWTSRPIMPGEKSKIEVKYNATIEGDFRKTIVVRSNAANSSRTLVHIRGVVVDG